MKLKIEQRHIDHAKSIPIDKNWCRNCAYAVAIGELCRESIVVGSAAYWMANSEMLLQPTEMKIRRQQFDDKNVMEPHEIEISIPKEWLKDEYQIDGDVMLVECERYSGPGVNEASTVHRDVEDFESDTDLSGPISG